MSDRAKSGKTPLHMAASAEAAAALIKHGAMVSDMDHAGRRPLLTAAYMGRKDVVDYLELEERK